MLPSDYDPAGYLYTRALIEDGRQHLLLGAPIPLDMPVRLLHGMRDESVPWRLSLRLAEQLAEPRCRGHAGQGRRPPPVDPGRSRPAGADARCADRGGAPSVTVAGIGAGLAAEHPERECP